MTLEATPAKRRRIDRYELLELIGEGGMGAVYRALDTRLGRTVALKTVLTSPRGTEAFNQELRQRFMREALAASKVEHRNVVQVIDFGVADDGTPYLVMEYLRGVDLAGLLKDSPGLLPIEQVADIMLNVCAALRACHQAGIVHRDLKPSNIFLAETDTGPAVKVLDFGVSKAPIAGDLTQEGQILGTPQYLSPEQVNGRVGPESDQYALGVLLYVCLTKRLPFEEHQNLSLLRAIEAGRFVGPRIYRPEMPEALEAVVLRAMHADARQRFDSVHALGQALWTFASARGQIEWRNFYFNALPSVGPYQPTELPVVPPRTMERTSILPTPEGTPGLTTPQRPQMMVPTRLAKGTPPRVAGPGDAGDMSGSFAPAVGRGRGLTWAVLGVAAAALVLLGILWRGRSAPAPERPPTDHPGVMPPPEPALPPVPPEHPTKQPPPPTADEAPAAPKVERPAPPKPEIAKPPSHRQPGRRRHGSTTGGQGNGAGAGIDRNGIGIPND